MEQRRFTLAMTLSLAIWFGWLTFFAPQPPPKKLPLQEPSAAAEDEPAIAEIPGEPLPDHAPGAGKPNGRKADGPAIAAPKKLVDFPPDDAILLGSADVGSGYFFEAELTTEGASVKEVRLNDPRYCVLNERGTPLSIVREVAAPAEYLLDHPAAPRHFRTMQTSLDVIDRQLADAKTGLLKRHWEVADRPADKSSVTFRMTSPDGRWEILKKYSVPKIKADGPEALQTARDAESSGYQLALELTVRNLAKERQFAAYTLQGPVGVPLENVEGARKLRDLRMGFLTKSGSVKSNQRTAAQLVKDAGNKKLEEWNAPVRYMGVDTQYFAALLVPDGDQLKDGYVSLSRPRMLKKAEKDTHAEISAELTSVALAVEPGAEVSHRWSLYAGPKREVLLDPLGAGEIVDFGFASAISRGMLWLLKVFHFRLGFHWVLAIISLTVLVRSCMFPVSKRMAKSAKVMKAMQPKIAELKKKYGDDKQKLGRAQMELFARYKYNPLAGCLPVFLQLPIFIGLYNALNSAVELRMAPFLYFDNLAGPDALFELPFPIPFLGTNDFNLLPIITVILYILQTKLLSPPPMDEQQAMNLKMMPYMMAFMGFLFYTVPAGLCVYFIASSLWGMGERLLLDRIIPEPTLTEETAGTGGRAAGGKPPGGGLFAKFLAMADAAANDAGMGQAPRAGESSSNGSPPDDSKRDDSRREGKKERRKGRR